MIIKGGSRAAPNQLGRHLARTDTNECVRVLELQSARTSPQAAFEDWQTVAEGTRGRKGLYHANIDPDPKYPMTEEQFMRAADVLEEQLGLTGQPRCVVLHEKGGRTHIHVVWQRTDIDTMTLVSDSNNYLAHERASQQLEREFDHEHVPGKHAKRDRGVQPDMPSAEVSHDEWQQHERGGLYHRERKQQVTALFEASDGGPAFKAALEDAGYVLVRGDKRGFVLLDGDGKAHSLSRQLPGVKAAELRAFMGAVDPASLPGVAEAREQIRADLRARTQAAAPEQDSTPPATNSAEPTPEEETRLATLLQALADRHAAQIKEQSERHSAERETLREEQRVEESSRFEEITKEAVARQMQEQAPAPGAAERLWRTVREAVSEEARAQREAEDAKRREELHDRVQGDIRASVAGLRFKQERDWENLDERHKRERDDLRDGQARDRERRIADEMRAREYAREIAQRERDALDRARDGPEIGGGRAR